jgi:hypothetical protein
MDIDKIIREWFFKLPKGYAEQPYSQDELQSLAEVLVEQGIAPPVTLAEAKFLKNIVKVAKRVWTTIKGKIKSLFSSKLKDAMPGEEMVISIPALKTEQNVEYMSLRKLLKEGGALSHIKGNYNEALTCQDLYNNDGKKGVAISSEYKSYKSPIDGICSKFDKDLKAVTGDKYKAEKKIIVQGSKDMARYLVGTVINEDAVIIGAYLDNLAFQKGSEFKADIQIAVMKEGKERLDAYSLKLYSGASVTLSNSSPKSLAEQLAGPAAGKSVQDAIARDKQLQDLIVKAKEADKMMSKFKKEGNKTEVDKWRALRGAARKPINPRLAEITYHVLKNFVTTPSFGENLLRILGFKDKETKMLMAITTKTRSIIIDKHPELDVSKIKLKLVGVSLKIMGPTGKAIMSFSVKEGEQKKIAGRVSFSSVEPVDLASYPLFGE